MKVGPAIPNDSVSFKIKNNRVGRVVVYAHIHGTRTWIKIKVLKTQKKAHRYLSAVVNYKKQPSYKQFIINESKKVAI